MTMPDPNQPWIGRVANPNGGPDWQGATDWKDNGDGTVSVPIPHLDEILANGPSNYSNDIHASYGKLVPTLNSQYGIHWPSVVGSGQSPTNPFTSKMSLDRGTKNGYESWNTGWPSLGNF